MGVAMIERDSALAALEELLAAAAQGQGRALVVVGEAGLGKTALLEHALTLAGDRFRVGVGRADVAEAALAFGLVNQALEPLLGPDAVETRGDLSANLPASHLHAVLRRLREEAVRPLLIALDDAHWADPDSLVLLRLICRRISTLPVALLLTARPWPPELLRAAEELSVEGLVDLERLTPLSGAAATSLLVERVAGAVPTTDIERAVAGCAGNPLLLEQVTAGLLAGQGVPAEEWAGAGRSSWVRRLLISPFAGVGEEARRYLRAASVLGSRFRPEVAAEVAGLTMTQAALVQEALSEAGLLADAGDGWSRFGHDLVRHAIYEETTPMRARLHEATFRALLARHASPGEVAEHAAAARLVGDPDALAALARAGHEALRGGAPGTARRHLRAAVDLGEDQVSPGVLLDLSQALRATGDQEGAADVCEALLRRPGLSERVRLTALSELAQARFLLGRATEALARIDDAVRLIEADRPELGAVALVDHALFTVMHLGPRTALPLAERARELGVRAGGPASVLAQSAWGTCAYLSGDPAGLTASEAAAATWPLASHGALEVPHWSNPHQGYSNLATWAERYAQVEPELEARVGEAERRSDPVALFQTLYALVELRCRRGRLRQALLTCDHLLESAELVPYALPLALAGKALALLELGRLPDAAMWCGRLTEMASREGALGWAQGLDLHRRGILALRLGELEAATSVFSSLEQLVLEKGLEDPCIIPWPGGAVDAYLGAGREDDAVRVLDWLEPRAGALPARWPKVVLARGRAALAERRGDLGAAEEHLSSALALHERLDMPLAKAETLTTYGSFLSRHDDPARGRPLLGEALRLAEECEAAWHAERARAAWRRAGGRGGRTPAGSLTPQEATVARLARAGKTNREIADQLYLSVNTVETHLRHIYRKLGIERRWQLIASGETTSEPASQAGGG